MLALTAGLWCSLHVQTDAKMHTAALFAHPASLVLGFGAVLSADYYGLLWATGRCALAEVVGATSRLHVPIWAGLGGLVLSGLMLHPDMGSPLTLTMLGLVAALTLNGLQAGLLARRLEAATETINPKLLAWGGATAQLSWPSPSQRRTRGMPRPIHEMISRWISLLPPPKVKMTALR
ncbi:hypothetical protein ACE1OC_35920 [Streptomyces sp. DSM 116496]|uniref:hypothetical protein n=1 Tax=Streptomyces stoeckheimensis TaxID=3344656 RepID=UPI0038B3DDEC